MARLTLGNLLPITDIMLLDILNTDLSTRPPYLHNLLSV